MYDKSATTQSPLIPHYLNQVRFNDLSLRSDNGTRVGRTGEKRSLVNFWLRLSSRCKAKVKEAIGGRLRTGDDTVSRPELPGERDLGQPQGRLPKRFASVIAGLGGAAQWPRHRMVNAIEQLIGHGFEPPCFDILKADGLALRVNRSDTDKMPRVTRLTFGFLDAYNRASTPGAGRMSGASSMTGRVCAT